MLKQNDTATGIAKAENQHSDATSTPPSASTVIPIPYSIYTRSEKWILVGMVAVAGLFSPLPANIYFPAIPALATVFHRSVEDINLTVTIYLAFQGASPMLWGPLSDRYGRRSLFLVCLLILVGSSLGLALCPTSAFWLLLLLRALQAGGCASTISLGAGVIGDIATVEERGGFFGMFNLGPMLAPCIGPAIGGVLSEHLGWRSIFWFLTIFSAACLAMILFFLPETMRSLVGNGSMDQARFPLGPLAHVVGQRNQDSKIRVVDSTSTKNGKRPSTNPFRLLIYPDIALTLTYTGIVYAVNYTITSTISSSFTVTYPYLSQTMIGICYLSTGVGMVLGSTITGKFLDWDYARIKLKQCSIASSDSEQVSTGGDDAQVPLEYARLRTSPFLLLGFVASVVGWGWCIQTKISIAGPLILQATLGYTSIAILNSTMTLMIDIIKDQSSGVIACTNLVRCSFAALLVSLIDKATQSIGYGWTYTLLGGLSSLLLPCIYIEIRKGPKWRLSRDKVDPTVMEE
ncbi:MFS general substrate transporter [Coniochaeta ligniaria NRRL 30616]|uniref:MFS general substrate transporter n=1 Tax=Coniochaeta ligniaria NRRL 30616 TaxID=1408157 RepID=A0A1J7JH08_9PEZI|nr:MFS general substrate transporter [Coniochaeta ligniaria NRRL 30616]